MHVSCCVARQSPPPEDSSAADTSMTDNAGNAATPPSHPTKPYNRAVLALYCSLLDGLLIGLSGLLRVRPVHPLLDRRGAVQRHHPNDAHRRAECTYNAYIDSQMYMSGNGKRPIYAAGARALRCQAMSGDATRGTGHRRPARHPRAARCRRHAVRPRHRHGASVCAGHPPLSCDGVGWGPTACHTHVCGMVPIQRVRNKIFQSMKGFLRPH